MMIDTCLILGIMEKEKLPNLGKYSLSSYKQESKFNKFSSFSLSKMLKNTKYCQSRFHFIHRLKLFTVKLEQLHHSLWKWNG